MLLRRPLLAVVTGLLSAAFVGTTLPSEACQCRERAPLPSVVTARDLTERFVFTAEVVEADARQQEGTVKLKNVKVLAGPSAPDTLTLENGDDCAPMMLKPGDRRLFDIRLSPSETGPFRGHINACSAVVPIDSATRFVAAIEKIPVATRIVGQLRTSPAASSSAPAAGRAAPPPAASPAPPVSAPPTPGEPAAAATSSAPSAPPPAMPATSSCGACEVRGGGGDQTPWVLAVVGVVVGVARRTRRRASIG